MPNQEAIISTFVSTIQLAQLFVNKHIESCMSSEHKLDSCIMMWCIYNTTTNSSLTILYLYN